MSEPRTVRRSARSSVLFPVLALLLGALSLLAAAPAAAQGSDSKVPLLAAQDRCNGEAVGRVWTQPQNHDHLRFCDGQNFKYVVTANAEGRCTETLPLFRDRTLRYCGSGDNAGAAIGGILSIEVETATTVPDNCAAAGFGAMHFRVRARDNVYYCNGSTWVAVAYQDARPDFEPSFSAATVDEQSYEVGTAITPLVLPAAEGGDGTLRYTLATLPAGLTFTAATRTLSGMPTAIGTSTMTYTATDADTSGADSDTLSFDIVVGLAAPTFNPANGATVTDAGTNITLTFAEAIKADDMETPTDFTDTTIDGILTLKSGSSTGSNIDFDATIDSAKKVVTINPSADLADGDVYVAISEAWYDADGNQGNAANTTFTVSRRPAAPTGPSSRPNTAASSGPSSRDRPCQATSCNAVTSNSSTDCSNRSIEPPETADSMLSAMPDVARG